MMENKQTKTIHRPSMNDYCDTCVWRDGEELGSHYCSMARYVNCGQVIECDSYKREVPNENKCRLALKVLKDNLTELDGDDLEPILNAESTIFRLINEYFNPRPCRFEDLKEGTIMWDNKTKEIVKIIQLLGGSLFSVCVLGQKEPCDMIFVERRFFPLTKALWD